MKRYRIPNSPFALRYLALIAGASLLSIPGLFAANSTWNTGSDGTWSVAGNWTAGFPGSTTGTTNSDVATFSGPGFVTVTSQTGLNYGGIQFDTTGSAPNSFVINGGNGNALSAGGSISTASTFKGYAQMITTGSLFGDYSFVANQRFGAGLGFSTVTTGSNLGTVTLTLDGANPTNLNSIASVISQAFGSTLGVTKNGAGTWVLNGANTFTGPFTLNSGVIQANGTSSFGTGSITVAGNSTIRTTTSFDISSRLSIADGATLTVDTFGNSPTWTGAIANSGTAGFTKAGIGVLSIAPASASTVQTYKGNTTINAGSLTLSAVNMTTGFTNLIDPTTTLVLGGGALGFTGKAAFASSQSFAATTLNGGVSQVIPAASSGTNTVSLGTLTRNTGGFINLTAAGNYTYVIGTATTPVLKGVFYNGDFVRTTSGTLGGVTYTTQNNASLWATGTSYQTGGAVSGTLGNGGSLSINTIRLNNASNQNLPVSGTVAVDNGIQFGSSIGANSSTISGGAITGNGDLIIVNNNGQNSFGRNTITSPIVDNGGTPTDVILHTAVTNGNLFIAGANTYTGNTYVGSGANGAGNAAIVTIGGAAGASIGTGTSTVYVNGGSGGNSNILRIGNGDATGDVLGTIQLDNGRLSLNRTDTFALSATVRSTTGLSVISQDGTGTATVTLASGTNFLRSISTSAAGTLNLSGTGSFNTISMDTGATTNYVFNAGSTTNFNGGTYILGGAGNSGSNGLGNWNVNGASLSFSSGRYFNSGGGALTLNTGTVRFAGDRINQEQNNNTAIAFNVNGGVFDVAANSFGFSLGGGGIAGGTGSAIFTQTDGDVRIGMSVSTISPSLSQRGLVIGGTAGRYSAYNLSGGVMRVYGSISAGGASVGGTNAFNWTGGRLTVAGFNATNMFTNSGVTSGTGVLYQGGTSSILSPGEVMDGVTYTGKTTITGGYQLDVGTLAITIGGTTGATVFHDASSKFDNVAVTGAAVLNASNSLLTIGLNGFTPTNSQTFTILTSTGLSGAFSNVAFGDRLNTVGGEGSFVVSQVGNNVVLSSFLVPEPGSALLLMGGIGVLVSRRRRRMNG